MLPPYESDEVAEAVLRHLASTGITPTALTVTADIAARTWSIAARDADGREVVASYPFAPPEGIHTPAELAAWFTAELTSSTGRAP
ncbi:MAG TPA: hypothetical protein VK939_16675 [Longimicrobiales bacterium]|nr:hypothetical protein [Longimicrobiales bacterium]